MNVSVFKHEHFVVSSEWELDSYSYEIRATTSLTKAKNFTTLVVEIATTRNDAFYTLTLFMSESVEVSVVFRNSTPKTFVYLPH